MADNREPSRAQPAASDPSSVDMNHSAEYLITAYHLANYSDALRVAEIVLGIATIYIETAVLHDFALNTLRVNGYLVGDHVKQIREDLVRLRDQCSGEHQTAEALAEQMRTAGEQLAVAEGAALIQP